MIYQKDKLFDWGVFFEGRANLGQGSNLTLIEGYGKLRLGIFELRAGRSKEIMGLCDTTLTSGSWAISGTNLGIPEVELSVRDFWTITLVSVSYLRLREIFHMAGWVICQMSKVYSDMILLHLELIFIR